MRKIAEWYLFLTVFAGFALCGSAAWANPGEAAARAEVSAILRAMPDDVQIESHIASSTLHQAVDAAVELWAGGAQHRHFSVKIWGRAVKVSWPWAAARALRSPAPDDLVLPIKSSGGLFEHYSQLPVDLQIVLWHRLASYAGTQQATSAGPEQVVWARVATGARQMRGWCSTLKQSGHTLLSLVPEDELLALARAYILGL